MQLYAGEMSSEGQVARVGRAASHGREYWMTVFSQNEIGLQLRLHKMTSVYWRNNIE